MIHLVIVGVSSSNPFSVLESRLLLLPLRPKFNLHLVQIENPLQFLLH